MSKLQPLVTIYMPTHNRPDNLKRAIESVKNLNYANWEFTNTPAQGACKARNVAIFHAKGEFITGLDDDDEFTPNRLDNFLANWSDNNAFLCTPVTISQDGKQTEHNFFIGDIQLSDLLSINKVGNQIFCKTKNLQEINGFNESFKAWQDYDTWLRFAQKFGKGKKLAKSTYIQYENASDNSITRSGNRLIGFHQFLDKHEYLMNKRQRNAMKCWEKIINLEYIPILLIAKSHPDIFKYALFNNIKRILRK